MTNIDILAAYIRADARGLAWGGTPVFEAAVQVLVDMGLGAVDSAMWRLAAHACGDQEPIRRHRSTYERDLIAATPGSVYATSISDCLARWSEEDRQIQEALAAAGGPAVYEVTPGGYVEVIS